MKVLLVFLFVLLPFLGHAQSRVGILIFDGVQIIDYTGPYEVFANAGYKVFTLSTEKEITTSHGMRVIPTYSLADHPRIDIAVVPGGSVPHELIATDPRLEWLRRQYRDSVDLLGVCNGVFMLGSAGLLEGREATTTASMISHLEHFAPGVILAADKRTTRSGTIFTCGGFMAGIDGALAVLRHRHGVATAQLLANNLEYNWDPAEGYVRSMLPDILLPLYVDVDPPIKNWEVIRYDGNDAEWCAQFHFGYPENFPDLTSRFLDLGRRYKWELLDQQKSEQVAYSSYRVTDIHDRIWKFQAFLREINPHEYALELSVSRH